MKIKKFITDPFFDGQAIRYNAVIEYFYEDDNHDTYSETDVESDAINFHDDGFIFANEFLARMNEVFGTTYQFSDDYKKEIGKKHGNSHAHKDYKIVKGWGDTYTLYNHYDYDSVKNCCTDFGDYTKETLIKFADAVDAYNKGVERKRTTDFNPDYKMTEERAEADKIEADDKKKLQDSIDVAVKALEAALSGNDLDNAVKAIKDGHHWDFMRIWDTHTNTLHNIHLDEMEKVTRSAIKKVTYYKNAFDYEVVNNKRKTYYSSDDRWRTWAGARFEEKNGNSFFSITPYETEKGIRFEFNGEIVIKRYKQRDIKSEFKVSGLTHEEMLNINNLYNDMWHEMRCGA